MEKHYSHFDNWCASKCNRLLRPLISKVNGLKNEYKTHPSLANDDAQYVINCNSDNSYNFNNNYFNGYNTSYYNYNQFENYNTIVNNYLSQSSTVPVRESITETYSRKKNNSINFNNANNANNSNNSNNVNNVDNVNNAKNAINTINATNATNATNAINANNTHNTHNHINAGLMLRRTTNLNKIYYFFVNDYKLYNTNIYCEHYIRIIKQLIPGRRFVTLTGIYDAYSNIIKHVKNAEEITIVPNLTKLSAFKVGYCLSNNYTNTKKPFDSDSFNSNEDNNDNNIILTEESWIKITDIFPRARPYIVLGIAISFLEKNIEFYKEIFPAIILTTISCKDYYGSMNLFKAYIRSIKSCDDLLYNKDIIFLITNLIVHSNTFNINSKKKPLSILEFLNKDLYKEIVQHSTFEFVLKHSFTEKNETVHKDIVLKMLQEYCELNDNHDNNNNNNTKNNKSNKDTDNDQDTIRLNSENILISNYIYAISLLIKKFKSPELLHKLLQSCIPNKKSFLTIKIFVVLILETYENYFPQIQISDSNTFHGIKNQLKINDRNYKKNILLSSRFNALIYQTIDDLHSFELFIRNVIKINPQIALQIASSFTQMAPTLFKDPESWLKHFQSEVSALKNDVNENKKSVETYDGSWKYLKGIDTWVKNIPLDSKHDFLFHEDLCSLEYSYTDSDDGKLENKQNYENNLLVNPGFEELLNQNMKNIQIMQNSKKHSVKRNETSEDELSFAHLSKLPICPGNGFYDCGRILKNKRFKV